MRRQRAATREGWEGEGEVGRGGGGDSGSCCLCAAENQIEQLSSFGQPAPESEQRSSPS